MAAAATEADIPPLLPETKIEGEGNMVDESSIDSISKLAQLHDKEPFTIEGGNFLIAPSVCEVQKSDQAAVDDDPGVVVGNLKSGNDQTLMLVSEVNRGHDETEDMNKGECPSNQNKTALEQVQVGNEITENAGDEVTDSNSCSKEMEKSTGELQSTQVIDGSHTERDLQLEKENEVSTGNETSLVSDIRDEDDDLKKAELFKTENNSNYEEEVRVEKSMEFLHAEPNSGHDNKTTASPEKQIVDAEPQRVKNEATEEKTMNDDAPKELQENIAAKATDDNDYLLRQVEAHSEQEEISSEKTKKEIVEVAGTKEECTEDVATYVVNQDSPIPEDRSQEPSEKQVSTSTDRDYDTDNKFKDGNSQKAELFETEEGTEKEKELLSTKASDEKELPNEDVHDILIDRTTEPDEVAATEKEASTSKPTDGEQPTDTLKDENSLKAESVETHKCTEKDTEISSSADALSEIMIQTTKTDATKEEITEAAGTRKESAKAKIDDESIPTADSIENVKCTDREMEVPSVDASSEKEISTASLQEISSVTTKEDSDAVSNSMEESIKDVAMNIPYPENRDTPPIAEDETKFSGCKVPENEEIITVDAKFQSESCLDAEVYENKECTKQTADISGTDEASSEKEIQAADSHELSSDKTKEEVDEVVDVSTKDITTNFSNQESEELSTSKAKENEPPTNTFEDESSLKADLVEKENSMETEMEISLRENSSEKEIETTETENTKGEITEKEVSAAKPSDHEQPTNAFKDESSLKAESVETQTCTEKDAEISSAEILSENRIQTTKTDATKEEIIEAAGTRDENAKAKIEDESAPTEYSIETVRCSNREMEVPSLDASSEKEIPTSSLQENSSGATKESDEVSNSMEENIKDIAMNIPNPENRYTPPVAEDETKFYACEVPENEAIITVDTKFLNESSLNAEVFENKECTKQAADISITDKASSEKEIQAADSHELLSEKTKEEVDEVVDVSTKDITTNFSTEESEELSTSKGKENESPTNTFEDENSLKEDMVEKENSRETEVEFSSRENSSEKEIEAIETEKTKEEITEDITTVSIQKEVSTSKPSDHEQPTNGLEDESSLKSESVEKQRCTENEMEISSAEALSENDIQITKTDATQAEITEVVDIRHESAKAEISPTTDSIENEKCIDREMEVPSMDASSEKEILTAKLQEISSDATKEVRDEAPNSTEENIKDIAMNIPNPDSRDNPPVSKDETKISACKVTEDEAMNTSEAKFENESSLKEDVIDVSATEATSSLKVIQAEDSDEHLSDKTKEGIDEVVDDITTKFPYQENEEVSTSKDREYELTRNTFDDESPLKAELVEKENCTEKEMEISSREVSSDKEIETMESGKTMEEISEVADIEKESTKDIETSFPERENKDTSAIQEDGPNKSEKEVSACKDRADNEPTNSLEANIEDEKLTISELAEKEKFMDKEISSTEILVEKGIPSTDPQEISTKEESDEVAGMTKISIKDLATDNANKENENFSQDDVSPKSSHEVPISKASDHDSENTLDAKFEDENYPKRELVEDEKCTKKETEVSGNEDANEKQISTADLHEVLSDKTEEKIYEAAETKDITTHVLDQENEDTSIAAEEDLQKPSRNEISTSKAIDLVPTNTLDDESSSKTEFAEEENCTEKEMEISLTELSSEKENLTTESDKTRFQITEVADIKEDGSEEESSQKVEMAENEKCTEDMEISSTKASREKEIPTPNLQEISSNKSDETADSKEESIKVEATNILNLENEDTTVIAEDGKDLCSVSEKAANTLEIKSEDELKAEVTKNEECTEKMMEILLMEASSEKEIQTVHSLKIPSEKEREGTGNVPNMNDESVENLIEQEGSQKLTQNEVSTSNAHDHEPANTQAIQLDNGSSLNAKLIENENCAKEEMDIPSTEASSEEEVQIANPQEASSDKSKEEIHEVADLKEECIKDVAVTAPNKENEGALPIAEESIEAPCMKEISTCKFSDNVVGSAVTDKFQDEISIKTELVENETSTEKSLVEEETPVEPVHVADEDIKAFDSRPKNETSFLKEEEVIEQHTEGKAHNATTVMVETCADEDVETDIPHDNANEKPPSQVHSSWMETDTLKRETTASTLVTEGAQAHEEKTTEANAESKKGIESSDKDNEQIPPFKDDSKKPSLEEASAGNVDDDKSTVVQDAKYVEENTTKHALSKDEKDVECMLRQEEFSVEPLHVSKDIGAIDTETETNYLEEQSVATNTQGIINEAQDDEIINTTALNEEIPDVDRQGHKKAETMYASDTNAEAPEEKDPVPTSMHDDTKESFQTQVNALETFKEPETKSVDEQVITSKLQEISEVKMKEETLDKQEIKFEDKETITAEFSEISNDGALATKDPTDYSHVAVKDVECDSGQKIEKSCFLQKETHEANHDKMDLTVETPDAENISEEESAIVQNAKYVERELSTHKEDTESTSGKEDLPSALKEDKIIGASDLNAETLENEDVATMHEDNKENLPTEFDAKQCTHLEKVTEKSSNVEMLTRHTTGSTLVKEESQAEVEDINLSTPCERSEARSDEEQIINSNPQEIPITKTEEETSDTISMTREALDKQVQDTKVEEKDTTTTAELNERNTDEAVATEEESVESLQAVAYDAGQKSENSSSLQEEILGGNYDKNIYDKEVEKTDKTGSTIKTPDTEVRKDVTTIPQEVTHETSISQMDLSQKEHETLSLTEPPKEGATMVKEDADVQCKDSLQEKEMIPVKDQIFEADSLITSLAITDEKTIIHETYTLEEGLEVKDNSTDKTDLKVSEGKKYKEQLEEDDTMKSFLQDKTHAESGPDERECKQEKILSCEIKDVQESTAIATLVANDSTSGMELTLDEKQQSKGKDEDTEHCHLGSCKEDITTEKQLAEEATKETHENIDNVNEAEKIPKVWGAGENAREPQKDLPTNESLDRSMQKNQEEKGIAEVIATLDTNQADHSHAELRTEHLIKKEETNMAEICEPKDMDLTVKVSKTMEEDGKEMKQHSLAKEPIDERLEQEVQENVIQVASLLDAENPYGTDNLHVNINQDELNTDDISEVKEITNETRKESKISEEAVQEPEEILLVDADKRLNQKGVASSTEEKDVQHQETKTEDSREEAIIESSPEHDVKPKEIRVEEACEVKENENETEKVSNVFKSVVENEPEKSTEEATTVVDTEEVNHVNIERKLEDSRELIAKDEVVNKELAGETEKEPKVSEKVIQVLEEDTEAYEKRDLEGSTKDPVEVEESCETNTVPTNTKIEEPRNEIITEGYPGYEVKPQEIIEKEICEVKQTPDETMKVAIHGVAETAVKESEENIHAGVAGSLQQKEPGKCVDQVSKVFQEYSELKTSVNRSLPQKEHDESVEEIAMILNTKEVCHEEVSVHTEARGEDLGEKQKAESHPVTPVDNETKTVSGDSEKVDDKAMQALEDTQKGIRVVTATLDTSQTGFEESEKETDLETVAEKDVEQLRKEAELATATQDTLNKNVTYESVPTQTVYKPIEHAEDKNKISDTAKEEMCQRLDQKNEICKSNELEVKDEESPMPTEKKGEDEKGTFNNKEETEGNSKLKDTEKPSLSVLFQSSTRETVQMADDLVTSKECTVQRDNQQQAEQNDDDPVKSQEEKVGDEELSEKRSDIIPYEAPVMVDAIAIAGDTEVKATHKKSHNILSGVGSKVKHSISKVKKAITGKSSHHPKQSSPN